MYKISKPSPKYFYRWLFILPGSVNQEHNNLHQINSSIMLLHFQISSWHLKVTWISDHYFTQTCFPSWLSISICWYGVLATKCNSNQSMQLQIVSSFVKKGFSSGFRSNKWAFETSYELWLWGPSVKESCLCKWCMCHCSSKLLLQHKRLFPPALRWCCLSHAGCWFIASELAGGQRHNLIKNTQYLVWHWINDTR